MVDASIQNAKQDKHKVETNLSTELIDSTQNKIEEKSRNKFESRHVRIFKKREGAQKRRGRRRKKMRAKKGWGRRRNRQENAEEIQETMSDSRPRMGRKRRLPKEHRGGVTEYRIHRRPTRPIVSKISEFTFCTASLTIKHWSTVARYFKAFQGTRSLYAL